MGTNVLLVDGSKVTREGMTVLLHQYADLKVVGEAADTVSAAKLASALGVDVAVMMVASLTPSVAERIRLLVGCGEGSLRVVVLLLHLDAIGLRRAFEAGAAACLSKDCASSELVAAIRAVRGGKTYLSPRAADEVVSRYVLGREKGGEPALSHREREVLQGIAGGEATREMAERLGVGRKTVETYRRRLMAKLGLRSVAGLTKYAVQHGFSPADVPAREGLAEPKF